MWEFSLNIKADNCELADKIFCAIKDLSSSLGGVVTKHEENGYISILIAVDEAFSPEIEFALSNIVTGVICTNFKMKFLENFLFLPQHDKVSTTAFKKALLNFDKETDKFLVQKNLTFDKSLFLESFYLFRLGTLRAKWSELVSLANENRVYLVSDDAFFDLLKFLVDNLDICEEEVDVFENEEGYKIVFEDDEGKYKGRIFNEEGLVSSMIDLAPQKINFYCERGSKTSELLEKIFDNRFNICKQKNFSTIKKF